MLTAFWIEILRNQVPQIHTVCPTFDLTWVKHKAKLIAIHCTPNIVLQAKAILSLASQMVALPQIIATVTWIQQAKPLRTITRTYSLGSPTQDFQEPHGIPTSLNCPIFSAEVLLSEAICLLCPMVAWIMSILEAVRDLESIISGPSDLDR
jgi:hypothetical protein